MHRKIFPPLILPLLLTACAQPSQTSAPADPDARAFHGTIISLRPMRSTMVITKDEHIGKDAFPNEIIVRYDAATQFLMDGRPTTLDKISQYMTVDVKGHMRNDELFAETANFSSVLPQNVRPAPATAP